jgi:nucleoside-diphosphate-sugar epimerase
LPSIHNPIGALPARFRRQRILIIGCGDIGLRLAQQLTQRVRVLALTSSSDRLDALRAAGIVPLLGDLDAPPALHRLAGLAQRIVHLAPPPSAGVHDTRTRALVQALWSRTKPCMLVYASTSGVYGDCQGASVAETRAVQPATARALRRVDAEHWVRYWARATHTSACVLRIPGIYAPNREGGTPRTRLQQGLPVLEATHDVYTNHIHADDLTRAVLRALWCGKPQRAYNINDDTVLKMGDYFDLAARIYGLPLPARIAPAHAGDFLTPMQLSFMRESRRMVNTRMKAELGLQLRYPTVEQGLQKECATGKCLFRGKT